MEEAIVGATVEVLLQNLIAFSTEEIGLIWNFSKDLQSLKDSIATIRDFLEDAEMKQVNDKPVQCWLMNLEAVAFDADYVFDQLNYQLLRKKVQRDTKKKLQELAMTMVELWTLMDTPVEEQQMFQNVTRTIAAAENEISEANSLSLEIINDAEAEVLRLQDMKMSKIKEVLLKKRLILVEICHGAHMIVGQFGKDLSLESIESGAISPTDLLEELEASISKFKEEAYSRKEILEKVQKWLAACEEECWLEEYSRDDNRYNAGRGAHLMLKRAEKARVAEEWASCVIDYV